MTSCHRVAVDPELLPVMLRASSEPDRLGRLLRQVGDHDLGIAAGLERQAPLDPKSRLTPREREVHDLLAQGLTNLQIAKLLFIGESTVKVHVHHIYDKLGIRSRTAIAVQAAWSAQIRRLQRLEPRSPIP